jgi:hypothetical protein
VVASHTARVPDKARRVRLYDVLDIRDTLESALESDPG